MLRQRGYAKRKSANESDECRKRRLSKQQQYDKQKTKSDTVAKEYILKHQAKRNNESIEQREHRLKKQHENDDKKIKNKKC